jgi:hypothetical protein
MTVPSIPQQVKPLIISDLNTRKNNGKIGIEKAYVYFEY